MKRKVRMMDYDSHNFDLEPAPAIARTNVASKITLAAMGAVAVVLMLIGLDVALVSGAQASPARPVVQVVKMSGTTAVQSVIYLTVSPGLKPGPDGKLHDAFSVTNFEVQAGQPIKLVINNTDSSPHSITAPDAGVNILVRPGTHTYTLLVRKAGRFEWYCSQPCDPYSMSHAGYMRGNITSISSYLPRINP
jgi:heme/copper-type cytochrome/quinol oxidase subunit 2